MGRSKKLKRAFDFFYKHNELRGLESISIVFERRRKLEREGVFSFKAGHFLLVLQSLSLSLCESSFSLLVLEAHQNKVELCVLAASHENESATEHSSNGAPPLSLNYYYF
uniref:Uncharacterized protein n=1 Tax=Opuntia streptacantha TaxID=393608 RepID=A0A7C8YL24_OPUST